MRWKIKPPKRPDAWHSWFAWYPVKINGYWVWLERVLRWKRFMGIYTELEYKSMFQKCPCHCHEGCDGARGGRKIGKMTVGCLCLSRTCEHCSEDDLKESLENLGKTTNETLRWSTNT